MNEKNTKGGTRTLASLCHSTCQMVGVRACLLSELTRICPACLYKVFVCSSCLQYIFKCMAHGHGGCRERKQGQGGERETKGGRRRDYGPIYIYGGLLLRMIMCMTCEESESRTRTDTRTTPTRGMLCVCVHGVCGAEHACVSVRSCGMVPRTEVACLVRGREMRARSTASPRSSICGEREGES